jgi:hypothetical protein
MTGTGRSVKSEFIPGVIPAQLQSVISTVRQHTVDNKASSLAFICLPYLTVI